MTIATTKMESAAEALIRQRGLEQVKTQLETQQRELHKLISVLAPTELHRVAAIVCGLRPVPYLATYRGVDSGKITHAVA